MNEAALVPSGARHQRARGEAGQRWTRRVRARLRERTFWYVQAGVVAVTILHIGVEAAGLLERHEGPLASVAHLTVVLYLLPVVYAGLRYGFEGGLLTGASVAVLASPNLFVWHRAGYDWVGESIFIAAVVATGAVVAIPVEREQRERTKAETAHREAAVASRRLALMNDVISQLVRTVDMDQALRGVLHRVMAVMDLETTAVATWIEDRPAPRLEACHSIHDGEPARLEAELSAVDLHVLQGGPRHLLTEDHEYLAPFQVAEGTVGAVYARSNGPLSTGEVQLLAAIGTQIGVALDNARMHHMEQEALHTYLQGITRAQEEERRRIARDLHDVATHELLLLQRDLEQPPEMATEPNGAGPRERIGGVIDYLRRFSRQLRPSVLEPLGLAPALGWLASQADDHSDIPVRAETVGRPRRLDPEVELALYRIAEEALHNAQRHARASRIDITVRFDPASVRMAIVDDGQGFATANETVRPAGTLGLGIISMQERASLVDAELHITSTPGSGTCIEVEMPT